MIRDLIMPHSISKDDTLPSRHGKINNVAVSHDALPLPLGGRGPLAALGMMRRLLLQLLLLLLLLH